MKIGILTFHFSHNVGSALQAYALRKYLMSHGSDVECRVINYEKKNWLAPPKGFGLKEWFVYSLVKSRIAYFTRFQRKYCALTKRVKRADLQKLNDQYDMFVFGGDQIWCIENKKVDDTYFGDFVKKKRKKVSYAPSFGITELPDANKPNIASLLSQYKCISVREKSGQDIVNDLLGFKPTVVLDPVFLVNKSVYDELEKSATSQDGYCMCYIRDKNYGIAMDYAKKVSKDNLLELKIVSGTDLNGKHFPIIGPERWLKIIKGSNMVVTNSFHAVCFSLIYHKDFFVDANQNGTRIVNILGMLGLEDRMLPLKDGEAVKPIDWEDVDRRLNDRLQISKDYIKQAIFS